MSDINQCGQGIIIVPPTPTPSSDEWVRPDGWPDLDALTYGTDELYMTCDNSGAIEDPFISFTVTGASSTVTIGDQSWTLADGEAFSYTFSDTDDDYPIVHMKADGNVTAFAYSGMTVNGHTYPLSSNAVVERVGDLYNYGGNYACTGYQQREKVMRHYAEAKELMTTWQNAYNLQELDVSDWDTTDWVVTDLGGTWYRCYSLKKLDVSGWNTENWKIRSANFIFADCWSLKELDLSNWVTKNWAIEWMTNAFRSCYCLKNLNLTGWDMSGYTKPSAAVNWPYAFSYNGLESLDISMFDMSLILQWGPSSADTQPGIGYYAVGANLREFKCGENNYGKFVPKTYGQYFNISCASSLSHAALVEFGKMLGKTSSTYKFVIGTTNSNKLTTAEKEEITSKGWTIA